MPKGAPDIEVILRAVLQQQRDAEIGRKAESGDGHDPTAIDRDRIHEAFHADYRDAQGGEQQHERAEQCGDDAGSMIAERPRFRGRARRQDMGVEGGKQSALIDEIVAGVADQSDAIEHQAADEFGGDDDCVQSEGEV